MGLDRFKMVWLYLMDGTFPSYFFSEDGASTLGQPSSLYSTLENYPTKSSHF